jgi:hypothetical protein
MRLKGDKMNLDSNEDIARKAEEEVGQKNGFVEAGLDTSAVGEPEKPDPPDIFDNFDTDLFTKPPDPEAAKKFLNPEGFASPEEREETYGSIGACPYAPRACEKAGTSQCNKKCDHNPEHFMDPKIKEVYDKEPWSNYCFTCGEFVPSRNHEDALDPPELAYSHTVATGYNEYKTKLRDSTLERLTGKRHESNPPPDWKHTI